jgi:AcrR family transcriptional regulator
MARNYVSSVRAATARATRARILAAAAESLRQRPTTEFSMEAVAKAAGVTRLTIYHQFGTRSGLLEALFDGLAEAGGLTRIAEAMTAREPRRGLDMLVGIFCDFWASDPAIERLHAAMGADTELAQALALRNERRREAVRTLVGRLPGAAQAPDRAAEAVDLIFVLLSYPVFSQLSHARGAAGACALLRQACSDALAPLVAGH